jgi:hypothetical protein
MSSGSCQVDRADANLGSHRRPTWVIQPMLAPVIEPILQLKGGPCMTGSMDVHALDGPVAHSIYPFVEGV